MMVIKGMNILNTLYIVQWITTFWLNPGVVWKEKCSVLEWP